MVVGGTSPRTRGKPLLPQPRLQHARNIPAHAGKTQGVGEPLKVNEEHPRARGENAMRAWGSAAPCGTSPRTRGKLVCDPFAGSGAGNIPAHAGKTMGSSISKSVRGEHPRARGENTRGSSRNFCSRGTSPRTRGKRVRPRWCVPRLRNIPAHAGKTNQLPTLQPLQQEHPRARGENRR